MTTSLFAAASVASHASPVASGRLARDLSEELAPADEERRDARLSPLGEEGVRAQRHLDRGRRRDGEGRREQSAEPGGDERVDVSGRGVGARPEAARQRRGVEARGSRLGEEERGDGPLVVAPEERGGSGGSGARRRTRGRAVSRTRPPPIVSCGDGRRRTKRSPRRAATGSRQESCATARLPGRSGAGAAAPSPRRWSLAGTSAVPVWKRTASPSSKRPVEAGESGHIDRQESRRLEASRARRGTFRARDPPSRRRRGSGSSSRPPRRRAGPLRGPPRAARAALAPSGKRSEPVLRPDPARVERPGDDRAEALHREGSIDPEACRAGGWVRAARRASPHRKARPSARRGLGP